MITQSDCSKLDQQDPISHLRDQFNLPPDVIYLDGNSLGAQPKAAMARVQQVVGQEWGHKLIGSWNSAGWFDLPSRLGDMLAPLIGAKAGEVVITDTTSINLFKALAAALQMQEKKQPNRKLIVSERSNFPTNLYMAQGLTEWINLGYQIVLVDTPEQLWSAINQDAAVVLLTQVNYRTGALLDMQGINDHARAQGVMTIWDLCHSAGALPIDLNGSKADLAVGCSYKYLNGGPGAPAFIWVPERHIPDFTHPLSGWWGHANPFAMHQTFTATPTIRRALCGTQAIVSMSLIESGLDIFKQTDMATIRSKSLALTDLFMQIIDERCAQHGLQLITPKEHARRGSHVSYLHPHAYPLIQALIKRGIIGDYREPSVMRFGFTPLYTSFMDVWNAADALRDMLDNNSYEINAPRHAVT
ncbi:kynureninase [Oxalobacteraceae bacterium GrIS 1.18]